MNAHGRVIHSDALLSYYMENIRQRPKQKLIQARQNNNIEQKSHFHSSFLLNATKKTHTKLLEINRKY